jgi:threonine efflux protein
MEYVESLVILVSVYMVSLISPGPNFIIVTNTSMSVSRTAGLFAGFGLAAASLTWAVMAMAGLGFLITHFEWLHIALRVVGAFYLIWLGGKMIRGAAKLLQPTEPTEVTWLASMRRAYIVSMTNPKSVAFFGSIFALVIPTHAPLWFYCVIAVICFLLSTLWYCGLAFFFSNLRVASYFLRFKARIERVMGAALIALGGRLLWAH